MASTVRIKTHGNTTLEGIELENFSTEETLAALLEQFKAFYAGFSTDRAETKVKTDKSQTRLEKLLSGVAGAGVGVGAAGGAGKISDVVTKMIGPALNLFNPLANLLEDIGELTPEVLLAVAAFKLVSIGLSIFQGALNLISRSITSLFNIAGNLVGTFVSGKLALSDYISAIQRGTASIPIIGTFTSLVAEGTAVLETWNQSLYDLTKIGANFNGNITALIVGAADAGLSVEQFSRVVKENADNLATFGSVMEGVNTYTKVSKISMQEYSEQLAGFGISFAQYSEELPRLLGLFGASAKAHGASDKELAQSAIELTAQFDAMSQLTGKTRDQQATDLQKLTADAAWQQKLTTLTRDQQTGYLTSLNEIQSTMGEGYAELYKFSVLGIPPLNKELQVLLATTPGLSQQFSKITAAVQTGVKGAQLTSQLNNIAADMVASGIRAGQNYETVIKAATAGMSGTGADIAKAQQQLLANKQEFFRNGQFDEQLFRQRLDQISKNRAAQDKVTDNLTQFSNLITLLRDRIYTDIIGPFVEKIAPAVKAITQAFAQNQGPLQGIMDTVIKMVNNFGDWVLTHGDDIKKDVTDFIDVVGNVIGVTLDVVKVIWSITKVIVDNWNLIKWGVLGLAAIVGVGVGIGLRWVILTAVETLTEFVGAVRAATIAIGGSSALGGVGGAVGETALAGEAVGGASILGLGGEAAGAGGLAALVGGEAATGIGIPLAIATGAIGGGLLLWQHFANKKKEEQRRQENVEKQSYTQSSPVDDSVDHLQNINETLMNHGRILSKIAENTDMGAKFSKKTAGALA